MGGFFRRGDGEVDEGVGLGGEGAGDVAKEVGPGGGSGNSDQAFGVIADVGGEPEPEEFWEVVVVAIIASDKIERQETSVHER